MNTQEIKPDPKPVLFPEVIVLNIIGSIGRTVRQDLGFRLGDDLPTRSDFAAFMTEHQRVRTDLGFHPQTPEPRYVFTEFEIRKERTQEQKGVPNVNIGMLVAELFERGYFLIDAGARVDERKRDVVRLTFSLKENDRHLAKESPSRESLLSYFKNRTYGYCHVWDRRWIRVDTGEQLGNMTVAVCGNEMRPQDCMTYRVMHIGGQGAHKGEEELMSFDLARHPSSVAPAKRRPAPTPTLSAPIGDRIKIPPKAKVKATTGGTLAELLRCEATADRRLVVKVGMPSPAPRYYAADGVVIAKR